MKKTAKKGKFKIILTVISLKELKIEIYLIFYISKNLILEKAYG
jgi:hypothetical protein